MASTSSSVNPLFGFREEGGAQVSQEHNEKLSSAAAMPESGQPTAAPVKKRRNLPGNPNYPDAEVIALSPNSLLATNRFICEVCNKGFQREQNLQLHRRGHNLPWKLRQKSTTEVRRRVYLCPEPTCVHHDPSRALGDLTGIKKHFCRKHGEKKFKCEKCSKRYAVQSDWKAHSKTCGTREYRCDCGTLFSRRDSFITHRAFCDALTQETKLPTTLNTYGSHPYSTNNIPSSLSHFTSLQDQAHFLRRTGATHEGYQFNHILSPPSNLSVAFRAPNQTPTTAPNFYVGSASNLSFNDQKPLQYSLAQLPDLETKASVTGVNVFNLDFFSNSNNTSTTDMISNSDNSGMMTDEQYHNTSGSTDRMMMFHENPSSDHQLTSIFNSSIQNGTAQIISATALLQKAAQMGSTTSERSSSILGAGSFINSSKSNEVTDHHFYANPNAMMNDSNNLQSLMNSLYSGSANGIFGGIPTFNGNCTTNDDDNDVDGKQGNVSFSAFNSGLIYSIDEAKNKFSLSNSGGLVVSDGLTRDFLGVGSIVSSMHGGAITQRDDHQHQQHNDGIDMLGSLDPEVKSGCSSRSYTSCASLQ